MSELRLKIGVFAPTESVSLAHHCRYNGSLPPTILLVRKLGWTIFYVV